MEEIKTRRYERIIEREDERMFDDLKKTNRKRKYFHGLLNDMIKILLILVYSFHRLTNDKQ